MQKSTLSVFILCNFHVYKWEKAYIKDLNAWRFLMNFWCIYLDEGKAGALMHVYVLEHIGSLSYRTSWWMLTKLDRDEVLMVPHLCLGFSANSTRGRIQGGSKIGQWGFPSQKDFFVRFEGYSNKPNTWQWSKSIWEEALLFLVPFWSQFSTRFGRLFGLSHFGVFNAIYIELYAVKCFICIYFV